MRTSAPRKAAGGTCTGRDELVSQARTGAGAGPAPGGDETKTRILDAALDEFSTHGVAGARVDRISATAGCNKNLLYVYFGSKDNLFTSVLAHAPRPLYARVA